MEGFSRVYLLKERIENPNRTKTNRTQPPLSDEVVSNPTSQLAQVKQLPVSRSIKHGVSSAHGPKPMTPPRPVIMNKQRNNENNDYKTMLTKPPPPHVSPKRPILPVPAKRNSIQPSSGLKGHLGSSNTEDSCTNLDHNYVQMKSPEPQGHDERCIVTVTGFDESTTDETLQLHFENSKKSGGGPVDYVSITKGTAAVYFCCVDDAARVLETRQELGNRVLRVAPFSESVIKHGFIVSGKSPGTTREMLKDFLEAKTQSTIDCMSELSNDSIVVLFPREHCPELSQLQSILRSSTLDSRYLNATQYFTIINDYDEPVQEHSIYATEEKIRYFKTYKLKEVESMMKQNGIEILVDSENYQIKLVRKSGDFADAGTRLEGIISDLHVSQHNITMPGVYAYLRCKEATDMISRLEKEEKCTLFVEEDVYEAVEYQGNNGDAAVDSDSTPGAESSRSNELQGSRSSLQLQPAGEFRLLHKSENMGKFQVGQCQFLLKEGRVETEEIECAVNITHSDIEQVGAWKKKRGESKGSLSKHLYSQGADWSRKGIIVSEVTGLPCKYSILVSIKHSGGNVGRSIKRCIKTADVLNVKSIAFFYKGISDTQDEVLRPYLRDYVESVFKYQRWREANVKDIRLVVDKMAEEYISEVQQGIEGLFGVKRKKGIWRKLKKTIHVRPKSSSTKADSGFLTYVPLIFSGDSSDSSEKADDVGADGAGWDDAELGGNEQTEYILGSEAVVCVCSNSDETNNRVVDRLIEHCKQRMPPRIISDPKIHNLTRQQIKDLRRRAGQKVELRVIRDEGRLEIRGFHTDVVNAYAKCKRALKTFPDHDPGPSTVSPDSSPKDKVKNKTPKSDEPPDTVSDTKRETKPGCEPETKMITKSDIRSNIKSNTKSESKSKTILDTKSNTESGIKSDVRSNTKSDTRLKTISDTKSDNKSNTESDIKSNKKTDTTSNTKSDSKSDITPTTKFDIMSNPKPDTKDDQCSGTKLEDEFDVFGKYIAFELRAIKDVGKRAQVKRQIQMIVFNAQE